MLIKFMTSLAGKQVIKPGQVVDMELSEARRHVAAGNAVPADAIETATHRARENALSEQRRLQEKETADAGERRSGGK